MTDDIVARLRLTPVLIRADELGQSRIDYEACKKFVNQEGVKLMREAADEIERMRSDVKGVKGLHEVVEAWRLYAVKAERDIRELRNALHAAMIRNPRAISPEQRKKDMFAARTTAATFEHHSNPWIKTLQNAIDEADRIRAERDEARRTVCHLTAERDSEESKMAVSAESIADEFKWECFKVEEEEEE